MLIQLRHSVFIFFALFASVSKADSLPYYDSAEFTPKWLDADDPAIDDLHRIAPFTLTDQRGHVVSSETTDGRIYVASFFFSSCPGICPTLRSKLSRVQEEFLSDDRVKILSHSIRPTSDTVEVLNQYAASNRVTSPNWHLLTGSQDAIYQLAKGSYFASEDFGEASSLDEFLHTENLLLIDQHRRIRGVYNGLSDASVSYLLKDIAELLDTEATPMTTSTSAAQPCH
ncbi:MAG: SCO family protein [Pseudomonadota bacterium]